MTFLDALKQYNHLIHPRLNYIFTKQSHQDFIPSNTIKKDAKPKESDYYVNLSYFPVELFYDNEWYGFNSDTTPDLSFGQIQEIMNGFKYNSNFNQILNDSLKDLNKKSRKKKKDLYGYTLEINEGRRVKNAPRNSRNKFRK